MVYDKSLRLHLLPSELIVKGFVKGEEQCNYECYLLELVNQSSFFISLSNGQSYSAPESESHGECDCISDAYQLDFKLIGGNTPLQARSLLSNQKYLLAEGVLATGSPKAKDRTMQATLIHAALRDYSYPQLCDLRKENPKGRGIRNDVCQFLMTLEKKKNLLLFFPYSFSFDTEYKLEEGSQQITFAINSDFCNAMKYRNHVAPGLDIFLCFIYSEHLVVLKALNEILSIVDYISLKNSPTYKKLLDYSSNL